MNPILSRILVIVLAGVCAVASWACLRDAMRAVRTRRIALTRRSVVEGEEAVHYGAKLLFFGVCVGATAVFVLYCLTMF
ncbi:MAG TPA: hypothetical protein VGG64_04515 [Pirellulales bacterium]|jgi:hypothetical protein|nr:hypothetical protein [Pirellulales bacterium]